MPKIPHKKMDSLPSKFIDYAENPSFHKLFVASHQRIANTQTTV